MNRRIILDPKPRRPQLPVYTEIEQKDIRDAAAAWDAAKAALDEAKKSLVQLEQELPQAQEDDAAADALLRSEGKPKLKGRPATQRHTKAIDEAAHEQLVAVRIEAEAFASLQDALDEHADDWAETIEGEVQGLDEEWAAAVNALVNLHGQRTRALLIRAMVVGGDERTGGAALAFKPSQIRNLDFAEGTTSRMTGWVDAGDVFAGLADLGMPQPPPPEPVQHPPLKPAFRGEGKEQEQQREFLERSTPEVVAERRKRVEQLRQEGELVLAQSLEG